ncbi:hypothetical protein GCM10009795_000400 [Nocardioides hankookensis]|uniref:AbiEi antitoxin C-terminal domain-containing protein n=1 Tax=Nocardioides hankookensis TaxID=443157 RepID=A0ABW1LLN6_9ACTN
MARTEHMRPPGFHPERPGLVLPVRVDPTGVLGPTPKQARGPHWRRTSHGFYVPSTVSCDVQQRIVESAHHLGRASAVTGWAALAWRGATWLDGQSTGGRPLPVEIASLQRSVRPQLGTVVTGECVPPPLRTAVDGLRVVTAVSAVAFAMRYATNVLAAVRVFDMAAHADLVSRDELLEHLELLYHWTGIPQAREAALLVDENAWSPPEVDVRVVWPVDLRLDPPLTNRPVFDLSGRHVGTPDLLDVSAGLAVQYDGSLHLAGKQRAKDLLTADDLRRVGLECLELVSADVREHARLVRRVREARERALSASRVRRWTTEAPPWWTPTHTVELRRALTPTQQDRLLGYRRSA